MEKVKVFSGMNVPKELEERINAWLTEAGDIEITRVLQSESSSMAYNFTITIFYKPKAHAHCREKQ